MELFLIINDFRSNLTKSRMRFEILNAKVKNAFYYYFTLGYFLSRKDFS